MNNSNPKIGGKNYSGSRLIYLTTSYPNIVHCNKCDDSSFIEAPQYSEEEKCGDRMAQYWLNGKE